MASQCDLLQVSRTALSDRQVGTHQSHDPRRTYYSVVKFLCIRCRHLSTMTNDDYLDAKKQKGNMGVKAM